VTDIDQFVEVREGQILRIVHPVTLQSDEVTVTADRISGSTINVATTTLSATYPIGSYVYVSAQSMQAGIIVGENAVRIYAEGQSLGRLAQPIDGTVTQIEAHLYTKLVRGMDFLIINQQTGRTYSINVDQDTAGPGVVTFNVQEQIATARVGDYLVGDNSFQQSQITVSQGEIVLKVDSNNRVALVRLSADNDSGSEIDISAEQVKINDIIFTESVMGGEGRIASDPYTPGSAGWKIDGDGSAEFNDVVVRGTIEADAGYLGDLDVDGTLTMGATGEILNSTNDYLIDNEGLSIRQVPISVVPNDKREIKYVPPSGSSSGRTIRVYAENDLGLDEEYFTLKHIAPDGVVGMVEYFGQYDFILGTLSFLQVNRFNVTVRPQLKILTTTDSSSKDTGSIITEGGIGVEKSAYIGTNLRVLGTTESTSTTTGSTVLSGGLGVAKNVHIGGTLIAPSEIVKFIEGFDSPYTVLSNDITLLVDTDASAVTLNLPAGTEGRRITVKHIIGQASTEPITIDADGAETIEGNGTYTINTDLGCVSLVFYSGVWYILSEII
jgi:hypothetical protein